MRNLAALLLSVFPACGAATPAQIRDAAQRAIGRLQASQKTWYDQQSCSSCHHQFLPALAFREARRHGLAVNEEVARTDAAQAFADYADLDRAVEQAHLVDPGVGTGYSLLAAEAAGVQPSVVTAVDARFLVQRQKPDGHWNTFDQRPPQSSSVVTATVLAIHVAGSAYYKGPDGPERIARARRWLEARVPRDTEERAFELMGLKWSGAEEKILAARSTQIEAQQQADGGWPSLDGRTSDAYSTGEILFAMSEAGIAPSSPAFARGIQFLIKSQNPDGTWHIATRLYPPAPLSPDYFESGYPYGRDQMISAMGASWAIMALARALGPARVWEPEPLNEAAPMGVEPWVETVLFGSAADVRRMLDSGFDPNSGTKAGTTALMLAAPDVDKLRLLLDRGAKVNERSHNGYSALMYAALYADSTPALQLLLDGGAEVQANDAQPLFHAYPAVLAAIAGNAEGVKLLHAAGDSVNETYEYGGIEPAEPVLLLATYDDVAVERALIESGAKVDQPDLEGLTPLMWAVLANQVEIAKLLIEHGADVNHVDKHGMTALLYAASIDYGDSQMIDVLLRAGARKDARTPQNLTALDLARKYRHTHLLARLGD